MLGKITRATISIAKPIPRIMSRSSEREPYALNFKLKWFVAASMLVWVLQAAAHLCKPRKRS